MNYTSIEQSKKLLELGLSPETADMGYYPCVDKDIQYVSDDDLMPVILGGITDLHIEDCKYPCWSTGKLLKLLPKCISHKKKDYFAHISLMSDCIYYEHISDEKPKYHILEMFENDSIDGEFGLLYNIYRMMCWCLENKYVNKIYLNKNYVQH